MIARAVVALAIAACTSSSAESPPLERPAASIARVPDAETGALFAKFECNRCHDVPGVAPPPRDKQCFGCHQQVFDGTFPAAPPALATWKPHVAELRHAPSLAHADRLKREWVEGYLLRPYDVRPGSRSQMPRLPLSRPEAEVLARYLVPAATKLEALDGADAARGEQLFRTFACARCHRFTGASVDDPAMHEAGALQPSPLDVAWRLAPDLTSTKDRMRAMEIVAWIVAPRGAMPDLSVPLADARDLAAYIVTAVKPPQLDLRTLDPRGGIAERLYLEVQKRVPLLAREVTWAEVERAVFRRTCWHCHAVPDLARGDGGPGNTGGFGFSPRGLDLSSYAGISSGSLDGYGERRSVFARFSKDDATPRLVVALLARHVEEAGFEVPGVYGMPLGLPALPYETIQLVATWIAQGRPN